MEGAGRIPEPLGTDVLEVEMPVGPVSETEELEIGNGAEDELVPRVGMGRVDVAAPVEGKMVTLPDIGAVLLKMGNETEDEDTRLVETVLELVGPPLVTGLVPQGLNDDTVEFDG